METTEILKECTVEGNVIKLPKMQLDRKAYIEVKKALELIGGKWKSGKTQGFSFDYDPTALLAQISEGERRNLKKEYQFFETPDELADYLVKLAEPHAGDVILEPSAGRGAIVKAIRRPIELEHVTVYGYELMDINQTFLQKVGGFRLLGSDFLTECDIDFDVIIANPPFSNNQDIEHIKKMYEHLNYGGKLVSIASRHWQFANNKKETAFREWLTGVNAEIIDIDAGTFKESGTMVATCIILITKK